MQDEPAVFSGIATSLFWLYVRGRPGYDVIDIPRFAVVDSAAEYLGSHLRAQSDKNLARLKIVAVISESSELAPYLTPK